MFPPCVLFAALSPLVFLWLTAQATGCMLLAQRERDQSVSPGHLLLSTQPASPCPLLLCSCVAVVSFVACPSVRVAPGGRRGKRGADAEAERGRCCGSATKGERKRASTQTRAPCSHSHLPLSTKPPLVRILSCCPPVCSPRAHSLAQASTNARRELESGGLSWQRVKTEQLARVPLLYSLVDSRTHRLWNLFLFCVAAQIHSLSFPHCAPRTLFSSRHVDFD
jgi:hypothetical protein